MMTRLSFVSTVHAEQGQAKVEALVAILEGLCPDIIFLEIPLAEFPHYENGTRGNLESIAARTFRENNQVALVPADLPTPNESFFRYDKYLHRRVEQTSPDYCHLVDLNSHAISTYGFSYLNSEDCSEVWSAIYQTIRVAVARLPDRTSLFEHLALSTDTNERRDRAMLKNIEEYCTLRPFTSGVLLAGAAHRRSLIDKSREPRGADTTQIEWNAIELPVWRGITTA